MTGGPPQRLASIDALRGITVAAMLLVNTPGDWGHVYAPLLHAAWHGATVTDLVFPFFLVLVGVSMAFSVAPRAADPRARPGLRHGVLARALRLLVAGLLLHLLAWWLFELPHFRLFGVLQRIALCAAVVGCVAIHVPTRGQWLLMLILLLCYAGALLAADTLEPWHNPVSYWDTRMFAPWIYQYDAVRGLGHDPEGLPSTLGALASTLLGLLGGHLLRQRRLALLLLLGTGAWLVGTCLQPWLPLNKNLWTPSFALWSGGLALLALAAAHIAVDRRHLPALGRRFGVNAITAYIGASVSALLLIASGAWQALYDAARLALPSPPLASLACAVAFVAAWWCVMAWLDHRRIYVRI